MTAYHNDPEIRFNILAPRDAVRTSRFLKYFETHPETRLVEISGTLTSRSIKDYAHLSEFARAAWAAWVASRAASAARAASWVRMSEKILSLLSEERTAAKMTYHLLAALTAEGALEDCNEHVCAGGCWHAPARKALRAAGVLPKEKEKEKEKEK